MGISRGIPWHRQLKSGTAATGESSKVIKVVKDERLRKCRGSGPPRLAVKARSHRNGVMLDRRWGQSGRGPFFQLTALLLDLVHYGAATVVIPAPFVLLRIAGVVNPGLACSPKVLLSSSSHSAGLSPQQVWHKTVSYYPKHSGFARPWRLTSQIEEEQARDLLKD